MSLGESNKSKYGGVSEFTGRLRNASGDVAATDASFERNGSLGLTGGMGILAEPFAPRAQLLLFKLPRLIDCSDEEDEEEHEGIAYAIGTCKQEAIDFLFPLCTCLGFASPVLFPLENSLLV